MTSPLIASVHQLALAKHLDRVRRSTAPCRENLIIRELRGGWMTREPGKPPAEFASVSQDRAMWMTLERKLELADMEEARETGLAIGIERLFVWVAPWAGGDAVEEMLAKLGAVRVPYVEYIAFSRRAGEIEPPQPTKLAVERVDEGFAPDVLALCEPWYWPGGIPTGLKMIKGGKVEMHAAFDGPKPVAIGFLALDGEWAYLLSASTDPDHRKQGAQGGLIRSRLISAAEHGVKWCSCETNTAVDISLRNLKRFGFVETVYWQVYRWDLESR